MRWADVWSRPQIGSRQPELLLRTNYQLNFGALALQGVLRLGFTTLVARELGPAGFSEFASILAAATLVSILWPASVGAAFTKFVGRESAKGEAATAMGVARHLRRRQVIFLCAASPVVFSAAVALSGSIVTALVVVVMSWGVSFQVFGRGVHLGTGNAARELVFQVIAASMSLVILSTILLFDLYMLTPTMSILLLASGLGAYGLAIWPRVLGGDLGQAPRSEIDRFIFFASIGSVASAGAIQMLILMGDLRLDSGQAGHLAAASSFAVPMMIFSSAVIMTTYPRYATLMGMTTGMSERASFFRFRVVLALYVGFIPIAVVSVIFAPQLLSALLGGAYVGSESPMSVLMVTVSLVAMYSPSVAFLTAGSNKSTARVSAATWLGLIVATLVWLLPWAANAQRMAIGYAGGVWLAGTVIVVLADRKSAHKGLWLWLCSGGTLMGAAAVSSNVATAGFEPSAGWLTGGIVAIWATPLIVRWSRSRGILAR